MAFSGLEVTPVEVQVQLASGMPAFNIVGLPDKAVAESKERVRAAIHALGISLPPKRITVNLAPADLAKEGSHLDLAIACGILENLGIIPAGSLDSFIIMGELALDGRISAVSGVLPASMGAVSLGKGLICPEANGTEATWAGDINIIAAPHLLELIRYTQGEQTISTPPPGELELIQSSPTHLDLNQVKGQIMAKRALIIAAAGGHNLLMIGPPGSGKSMLASRMASILPPLTHHEILESSMIASVAGLIESGRLSATRPYRAPHHSCSMAAMVGGGIGKRIKPGEVTLAHHGVLFLDELPEFNRQVLDALRQPIETGTVLISRSGHHITYPSRFQLIAAMNPCHCGYLTIPERSCSRAPKCATNYLNKVSGPIYDRFDLKIEVNNPDISSMLSSNRVAREELDSTTARTMVLEARNIQMAREENNGKINANTSGQEFEQTLSDSVHKLMKSYIIKTNASMRTYYRAIKVARTIADLAGSHNIAEEHAAEALSFRSTALT